MDQSIRSEFAAICRNLRIERALKQRQVAEAIGVKLATYGNLESSRFKVISDRRAEALSGFYGLSAEDHERLMLASAACPLSPGGEIRRATWAKLNTQRSKAKNHDALKLALVNPAWRPPDGAAGCRPLLVRVRRRRVPDLRGRSRASAFLRSRRPQTGT